ncbi:MAG: hypothetical protein LW636_05995 [Planctomycetaceae bacterium]|nr:hypothetical protein [Planctomycetaceae bacterium]
MDFDERLSFGSRGEPRDAVERACVSIAPDLGNRDGACERLGLDARQVEPAPAQHARPLEPRQRLTHARHRAWVRNHRREAREKLRDLARRKHPMGIDRRKQRVEHEERVRGVEHLVARVFRPRVSLAAALETERPPCTTRARPYLAGKRGEDAWRRMRIGRRHDQRLQRRFAPAGRIEQRRGFPRA